jgi:trehalose 6-phosphate synthase
MTLFSSPAGPNRNSEASNLLAIEQILHNRPLIIASNRGPVTFRKNEQGVLQTERGRGGLVTALTGVVNLGDTRWIACARTEEDKAWGAGEVPFGESGETIQVQFISPAPAAFDAYYNGISNPLLWFMQHSMWDISRTPTINRSTWQKWKEGYAVVNMLFAEAIAQQIEASRGSALVMLQDYHLYLTPGFIKRTLQPKARYTLIHFIHIPWPGAEDWGLLPPKMRQEILESLCAVDLLGFQTHEDGMNFLRTCESYLPRAHANFKRSSVWYYNHSTFVRDFPISIDVEALKRSAQSTEVKEHHLEFRALYGEKQLIVRIDRIEPSKNIVRGFQAFDEMLDLHPEHIGRVIFLALLVPSRLEVDKYQDYLAELMAAAGKINAKHGSSNWEPVRILVGEDYLRAVAAMELYDVLLVNSIADGMNLVAKEGPIVNQVNGVLILSERTGARQQLESGALVIPPLDIYATAEALHQALVMPLEERLTRSERLRRLVEQEDIVDWLCSQLEAVASLNL